MKGEIRVVKHWIICLRDNPDIDSGEILHILSPTGFSTDTTNKYFLCFCFGNMNLYRLRKEEINNRTQKITEI